MHHLPRIFARKKHHKSMVEPQSSKPNIKSMDLTQSPRKLVRRNAAKKFNYTPPDSSAKSSSIGGSSAPRTRSLDAPTSFRIEGKDGEVDRALQNLGLFGPEDFEIPTAAYELMKTRSCSDVIEQPKRSYLDSDSNKPEIKKHEVDKFVESLPHRFGNNVRTSVVVEPDSGGRDWKQHEMPPSNISVVGTTGKGGGIKGDRPPLLSAPLPSNFSVVGTTGKGGGIKGDHPPLLSAMALLSLDDGCSSWDLLERLVPDGDRSPLQSHSRPSDGDVETDAEKCENTIREEGNGVKFEETVIVSGTSSLTTSNDDDSSSTTTDPVSVISPSSVCRINITHWDKGKLLGRGSFGTVYEGIFSEGSLFAMKEVSLIEEDSKGKQSIYQLEQEIELLSQFEHENIVRYYGTAKADSKLYIFLELVPQGSLASLYGKYHLRDSHVSNYTRQILMGLKYLHDRNIVHRDIKCANILVAADGTVKLADFGLAKATQSNNVKSCKGTPFWMAPEVIYHKNQGYGLAADIWSLGCTVLEMLTGNIPYYPLEPQQALFRIGHGELPPIPGWLSLDALDFIQQCLRVKANDRPTAAELLDHQFVRRPLDMPLGSESPMIRGTSI